MSFSEFFNGFQAPFKAYEQGVNDRAGEAAVGNYYDQQIASRQPMSIGALGATLPQQAVAPQQTAPQVSGNLPAMMPMGGDHKAFIEQITPWALEASKQTGVDPKIIIGQAALESNFGKSAPGNNLFGIKDPKGQQYATNEVVNGQTVRMNDGFAGYDSPQASVQGYADFINKNPRYGALKGAQGLDAQLSALQQSGYATDPNYSQKVGSIARTLDIGGAPTQVAQSQVAGGTLQQLAQAPIQNQGLQPTSREDMLALFRSEKTRPLALAIMQQNLSGKGAGFDVVTDPNDGTIYQRNKGTGEFSVLKAGNKEANDPYTLGEGQVRYDAKGNVLARGGDKAADNKIVPAGGVLIGKDGGVVYQNNTSTLDDNAINTLADQLNAGDTSVLTNLGRGNQGAENVMAIRQRAAQKLQEQGITGAQQASTNAEYGGMKSGQRALGTRSANIGMAVAEAQQMIPLALDASNSVDRTAYPSINAISNALARGTGDKNIVTFLAAHNSLINVYARAINGGGAPTVSDKEHAREILDSAYSKGQYAAGVSQLQKEMAAAQRSPDQVKSELRQRYGGGGQEQKSQSNADPLGIR